MRCLFLFSVISLFSIWTRTAKAQIPCTACKDGSSVGFPDRFIDLPIELPGMTEVQCSTIEAFLPLYISDNTSQECQLIQSLGSLYGCPEQLENGRSLCGATTTPLRYPERELPMFDAFFLEEIGLHVN